MQKIKVTPTNYELRIFALIFLIGFFVFGIVLPFVKGKSFNFSLTIVGSLVFVVGMGMPKILIKPRQYWINIGNVLGRINGIILFTLLYFFLFSSIGLILKLTKRDRMKSRFRKLNSTMVMKTEISTFADPF